MQMYGSPFLPKKVNENLNVTSLIRFFEIMTYYVPILIIAYKDNVYQNRISELMYFILYIF